jgi:putative tryptophan/tyrosine transport system substrate-binding protein
MNRRQLMSLLGGAVGASYASWPLAVRAQQPGTLRRIGVLMNRTTDDPDGRVEVAAFVGWLQERGWTPGANLQIDYRWSGGSAERARALAAELVALAPAVIMTIGASHVAAIQQVSRTVPIVFIGVTDPVGGGLVASMARPGGNATGIILAEFGTSAKWLELLKQISPQITRAAVIIDPSNPTGTGQFGSIQSVAPSMGVVLTPVDVRNAGELDRGISEFAGTPNGGLIVVANPLALVHRDAIIGLAARLRLPAVYFARSFVASGGLVSYGPDFPAQYRQAAGYIDRILRGEKPADLPVQAPTKYDLVINLRTAKVLGLEIPPTLLARADEVIE